MYYGIFCSIFNTCVVVQKDSTATPINFVISNRQRNNHKSWWVKFV